MGGAFSHPQRKCWGMLHYAAAMNALSTLRVLCTDALCFCTMTLQAPALSNAVVDAFGRTALHICCVYDHVDILVVLLRSGMDATVKDVDGRLPLDIAIEYNAWFCICVLLQWYHSPSGGRSLPPTILEQLAGYRWSSPDAQPGSQCRSISLRERLVGVRGYTLLHIACCDERLFSMASWLAEAVPELNAAVSLCDGSVALHLAAAYGSDALQALLLRLDKGGVACTAKRRGTNALPVHTLCECGGAVNIVSWMRRTLHALRLEVEAEKLQYCGGRTVLHGACGALALSGDVDRHFATVKLLTSKLCLSLRSQDDQGRTPLDLVEASPHAKRLLPLLRSLDEFYESHDF